MSTSGTGEPNHAAGGLEETLAALASSHLEVAPASTVREAVESMVAHVDYPCLGAKSVYRRDDVVHVVLDDMTAPDVPATLLDHLRAFADDVAGEEGFHSFVVTFRGPHLDDEAAFEGALFDLLQAIHDRDGSAWAPGVGADPTDPHFAFSAGGAAYFIVGLHPRASRVARRAPLPTLVFNPHEQFEELRRSGRFAGMRTTIRRRDEQVQGTVNPMADDHGDSSEALQYSGRAHDDGWEPPLEVRVDAADRADAAVTSLGHGHENSPTTTSRTTSRTTSTTRTPDDR